MATRPGVSRDLTDPNEPGSPFWWMKRLVTRLMERQSRYDFLEDYAIGNHPIPQGDRRYIRALKDIQQKAKTNYVELVIRATVEKMRVKAFRFGADGIDDDAQKHWQANEMDYQSPVIISTAATMGFCFALVSPPEEPGGVPLITAESPRLCEIERDPQRLTRSLAGIRFWEDRIRDAVVAVLYLPDVIYTFEGRGNGSLANFVTDLTTAGLTPQVMAQFEIVDVQENTLGEVPLVRGDWQPSFGDTGRAEAEIGFSVQDRINKTILDRLVISNNQAFRQRWVTGVDPKTGKNKQGKAPFDPGADMVWATASPDARFGDFQEADIKQILEAVRDDVGDFAAITQTPSTYLTNRMINVSGDTLAQAQAGHIAKVKLREDAMGFFFERIQKLCFRYLGDERADEINATTVWHPVESKSIAEGADALGKWVAAGIPLALAMDKLGEFDPVEIEQAVQAQEQAKQEQMAREDELLARQEAANQAAAKESGGQKPTNSQEEK